MSTLEIEANVTLGAYILAHHLFLPRGSAMVTNGLASGAGGAGWCAREQRPTSRRHRRLVSRHTGIFPAPDVGNASYGLGEAGNDVYDILTAGDALRVWQHGVVRWCAGLLRPGRRNLDLDRALEAVCRSPWSTP